MTNRNARIAVRSSRTSPEIDHRLESLEGRSLMSAAYVVDASHATPLTPTMAVADASFLNASSDTAPAAAAGATDSDMYDFGGAWGSGSRAPRAAGAAEMSRADIDMAFDDNVGHPRGGMPSDLSGVVHATYGDPAPYGTTTPIMNYNTDDAPDDSQAPAAADAAKMTAPQSAPAPVVNAPATPEVKTPVAAPISPDAGSVSMPEVGTWIDVPQVWAKGEKASVATQQVVIASTFVQ